MRHVVTAVFIITTEEKERVTCILVLSSETDDMIYTLTQELEDLLAVTYVMNAMLYILENEEQLSPTPSSTQRSPIPAPRKSSSTFSTFVNQGLVEVKLPNASDKISPEMEASLQSIVSAVSSTESISPQDPIGSRDAQSQQEIDPYLNMIPPIQQIQPNFNQAIQIEGKKEPLIVTSSSSGNRILAKLQDENEKLFEQVEVLEKMNNRLEKRLKESEGKVKMFEEGAEGCTEKEKELDRMKREDEIKNKTLADLLVQIEEIQSQLAARDGALAEAEEKLKENNKKLAIEQKKVELFEVEVKNYLTDQPDIEKMEIVKSYLHPEMEKYAIEALKAAFGTNELRGDASTAFVSAYFDELYGEHWQSKNEIYQHQASCGSNFSKFGDDYSNLSRRFCSVRMAMAAWCNTTITAIFASVLGIMNSFCLGTDPLSF